MLTRREQSRAAVTKREDAAAAAMDNPYALFLVGDKREDFAV